MKVKHWMNINGVKDFEVISPPDDGISDLAFSSQADFLAAASWDNKTRIWEVQPNGSTVAKAVIPHEGPVLSVHWSKDGTKVVSGGADKAARMMDLATGTVTQVAAHDAPIKSVRFVDGTAGMANCLATGSWDKTVKYWDLRAPNAIATLQLPERCYSMDVTQPLMVVGTAEKHICIVNLSNPTTIFKTIPSPLKWQTRVVSTFHNATGFAVGSIEGRVGIQYIDEKDQSNNFSFKCHRDEKNVFSVNAISFHPIYGTFSTAGADGTISFWDKDVKQRLKSFPNINSPISATAFNKTGTIFAYAASYDWSKGHEHYQPNTPNKIYLHAVKDEDIRPRPGKKR